MTRIMSTARQQGDLTTIFAPKNALDLAIPLYVGVFNATDDPNDYVGPGLEANVHKTDYFSKIRAFFTYSAGVYLVKVTVWIRNNRSETQWYPLLKNVTLVEQVPESAVNGIGIQEFNIGKFVDFYIQIDTFEKNELLADDPVYTDPEDPDYIGPADEFYTIPGFSLDIIGVD